MIGCHWQLWGQEEEVEVGGEGSGGWGRGIVGKTAMGTDWMSIKASICVLPLLTARPGGVQFYSSQSRRRRELAADHESL